MRHVLTIFVLLLAFASASPMPQHGNDRQKRQALVVPREIVLPSVAFQPDLTLIKPPATPRVLRISVLSAHSTEIAFHYAFSVFPEGEPIRDGAIECYITR